MRVPLPKGTLARDHLETSIRLRNLGRLIAAELVEQAREILRLLEETPRGAIRRSLR